MANKKSNYFDSLGHFELFKDYTDYFKINFVGFFSTNRNALWDEGQELAFFEYLS